MFDGTTTRRHRLTRGLIMALAGVALVAGMAAPSASADPAKVNPTTLVDAKTSPAVQLMVCDVSARISVPDVTADEKQLAADIQADVNVNNVDPSDQQALEADGIKHLLADPGRYLIADTTRETIDASAEFLGTGFIITPDGYVVTAAHVVNPDPQTLNQALAAHGLASQNDKNAQALKEGFGNSINPDQLDKVLAAAHQIQAKDVQVDQGSVKKQVSFQLGTAVAGAGKGYTGKPIDVIDVGEGYPGKDVAIVKVNGVSNLPTVSLGDDSDVNPGDTLFVSGFPVDATFNAALSKDSTTQPQTTSGTLTKKAQTEKGIPIFETQAPAKGGNSGGPVLDESGKVVGSLVVGLPGQGDNFVMPVSVIKEKLALKNVRPVQSETSRLYNQAVDDFYKHYYKRALPVFQQVLNLDPAHPYAQKMVQDAQTAISAGKDQTPTSSFPTVPVAGAALAILLAAAVVVVILRRGRRGSEAATDRSVAPMGVYPAAAGLAPKPEREATRTLEGREVMADRPLTADPGNGRRRQLQPASRGSARDVDEHIHLAPSARRVLAVLEADHRPHTADEIGDAIGALGHPLKEATIEHALLELREEGLVEHRSGGNGRRELWRAAAGNGNGGRSS